MTDPQHKTYYITTPIYYVNGLPHVGAALTTVACDVLARYHRLRGHNAWLLTGTDENASKVHEAALEAGIPPLQFVEDLSAAFHTCWQQLHVGFDDFIRTTEPRHLRAVQEFVARLRERGYVYSAPYEGWYSVSDETFVPDNEVEDGVFKKTGKPVVRVKEESYFFRLSAFGDRLLAHIEANPDFLLPEFRRNEVIAFIKEGLRDMSITRSNRGWGIPFPGDESKVIYVWFDALINYLAATGWPERTERESFWPADVHFMGKEIFVRFHATLWPAMLMALDLPLPKQIYAHGWWTVRGIEGKAGKSTGGLPHPTRLSQFIAMRSGASFALAADAQRYLLCREMNFGLDTEFNVENLLRRYNTDLANDLGNLLNRSVNMVTRYLEGVVPEAPDHDHEIAALALQVREEFTHAMAEFRLNAALESVWKLVGRLNKYIDETAPWSLAKAAAAGDPTSATALRQVLYTCLESTRIVAGLVAPFMPVASRAILEQLGLETDSTALRWPDLAWGRLAPGSSVRPPHPLFPRIQDLAIDAATLFALCSAETGVASDVLSPEKESTNKVSSPDVPTPPPGTPVTPMTPAEEVAQPITIEEFMKVQLRVAEVLAAEPVPNATKLLRLTVQVGEEDTRTILAGIAEYYAPEALVGRKVVIVANLQPRKMRGIESQGMLLAADVEGRAVLLSPEDAVPSGARVR